MANQELGNKLQSLPKGALYLILILVTSIPLFFGLKVPNTPTESSIDMFAAISRMKAGETVLIASDWTGSTRGESGGQFEVFVKMLMRRGIKFAVYSSADPQAPQVAKDAIARVNAERVGDGQKPYEQWNDWVSVGFLPNAEAAGQAMAVDLRKAWEGRKGVNPVTNRPEDVVNSPVLKDLKKLEDAKLLVIVTASKTSTISIERFYGKVPLALMVTGVMGPESQNYYASGQVVGLLAGLRGLLDFETLMEVGVNTDQPNTVKSEKFRGETLPGFPGEKNAGKGAKYYPTLHFALALLISVVIIGNIGMFMSRKGGAK